MNAQTYVESKLSGLHKPLGLPRLADTDQLIEAIYKALLSKKFRNTLPTKPCKPTSKTPSV